MGYEVKMSEDAKDFIATKGYDPQFGARPLKRAIQTYIEDELCELLLADSKGHTISIDKANNKLCVRMTDDEVSEKQIAVDNKDNEQ